MAPFSFGKKDDNTKSDGSTAPSGGFKFGASATPSSGEKTIDSASSQQPAGGFKFGASSATTKSDSNSTSTSKPEESTTTTPGGGFKFGVQETGSAGKPAGVGGFSFGKKAGSDSIKPDVGTAAVAPGGFGGFKPSTAVTTTAALAATTAAAPMSSTFTFGSTAPGSTLTTPAAAVKPEAAAKPLATGGISFGTPLGGAKPDTNKVDFKPGRNLLLSYSYWRFTFMHQKSL